MRRNLIKDINKHLENLFESGEESAVYSVLDQNYAIPFVTAENIQILDEILIDWKAANPSQVHFVRSGHVWSNKKITIEEKQIKNDLTRAWIQRHVTLFRETAQKYLERTLDKELLSMHFSDIGLSGRSYNCLMRNRTKIGGETFPYLLLLTLNDFKNIKGFGRKMLVETAFACRLLGAYSQLFEAIDEADEECNKELSGMDKFVKYVNQKIYLPQKYD